MNQYVCVCVCACWQREPKVSGQRSDQNTSQDYLQDKDHMVFWPTSHTKQTQTLHWLHLSPIILCFLTSRIADAWAVSEVRTRIHTHTKWFSTLHNRKMRVGTTLPKIVRSPASLCILTPPKKRKMDECIDFKMIHSWKLIKAFANIALKGQFVM